MGSHPRAALVGFRNVLTTAVLYEIAILLWAFGAEGVTLPAFLIVPEEQYYFYELVFLVPLFLCTWLLASAIAYLTSKAMGGTGAFDAILGGFGLTMATLLPTSLFINVDLPALGFPRMATNPQRKSLDSYA